MKVLVYSQVWVALSGLALLHSLASSHGQSLSLTQGLLVFCGLLWVYLLDAAGTRSPEDQKNQPERVQFFKNHYGAISFFRVLSLGVALYLAISMMLPPKSWIVFCTLTSLAWFYSVGFRRHRLKKMGWDKTWLVALAWGVGSFSGLWALGSLAFPWDCGSMAGVIALLFFDTMLLDWRDRIGDATGGIRSVFSRGKFWMQLSLTMALLLLMGGFVWAFWTKDEASLRLLASYSLAFVIVSLGLLRWKKPHQVSFLMSGWRLMGCLIFYSGVI